MSSTEICPVANIESLLSETIGSTVGIKTLEWKPLTGPGENFGSEILAINITVTDQAEGDHHREKTLHLVAKLPPKLDYLLELFNSPVTFRKELLYYSTVVTELINIQRESGISESDVCTISPKYYGGRLGIKNPTEFDLQAAIVLENLKYTGYDTQDRIAGLDKPHGLFAVKELAKMHGIAIGLKLKNPLFFEQRVLGVLKQAVNEAAIKCVRDMARKALEDMRNIVEAKPFIERAEKTIALGMDRYGKPNKVSEPWGTLVHNDFWVNNMMFKHTSTGDILDMKIVDFQLSTYDYGMCDLIFFLMSSIENDVLDESVNEFLDTYYTSFIRTLDCLNIETTKFNRGNFMDHLNHCGPVKFIQCIMMIQVIQARRDDSKRMNDDASGPEDIFVNQSDNDVSRRKIIHVLKMFDRLGWLLK